MMRCNLILFFGVFILSFNAKSQNHPNIKFGDVTAKDFETKVYTIDSNAQAVILYDYGSADYVTNSDSWFDISYTYHKRVRILNKNAFDLATIQIPLYKGEKTEEVLNKIEASTYTMENGVVNKVKLDKQSLFKDKIAKNYTVEKFTFPNLKEGCIIEYSYTIVSPRWRDLRSWYFQTSYPVLQSKYEVTIPQLFNFVFLPSGYFDLKPTSLRTDYKSYNLFDRGEGMERSQSFVYKATIVHSEWIINNLPAIKKEKFLTTLENHISKIEFQIKSLDYPDQAPKPILSTWDELVKELLKDEQFGAALSEKNKWMDDDLEKLIIKNDTLATAKNIFDFVKNNFVATGFDCIYLNENLKKTFQDKKGNASELNLVLVALLKKAKINAEPLILSTRDNGLAYEMYPLINKFNYVITRVLINEKEYLLDASKKKIGFNHLPDYCYNGYARIIGERPYLVPLFSDSLKEKKTTNINFYNSEDGKKIEGSFSSTLGHFESFDFREEMTNSSKEAYFKKIKNGFSYDITLSNQSIDSLDKLDERIAIKYDFATAFTEDIIYFNPLFGEAYKTNPFTAATRNYPVEMPYQTNEVIIVYMDIPKGYKVDEIPKSVRVKYNDEDGMFEYIVQADANSIQLRSKITLNRANFDPEEYQSLRDFFGQIVKKQSEQIVFKKIK